MQCTLPMLGPRDLLIITAIMDAIRICAGRRRIIRGVCADISLRQEPRGANPAVGYFGE